MEKTAVRATNLSKSYHLQTRHRERELLGAALLNFATGGAQPRTNSEMIWALKDVSFEIKQGQSVGFIGPNGAGKSTLMRILARVTEPTSGGAEIRGRVGSMLEVGTGFHQELTGRENIYFSGSILGVSRPYIESKFDEIVEFAGVEKFLDTPVKFYSSGQYMRLGVAVAAHLDQEILLIDEALSVGDAAFRAKCGEKMKSLCNEGRTVLLVTHNLEMVRKLCTKAIWLDQGTLIQYDDVTKVLPQYHKLALANALPAVQSI